MLKTQASDSDEGMQIDTHGPGPSGINQPEVRKKPSKMKNPRNSAGSASVTHRSVLFKPSNYSSP